MTNAEPRKADKSAALLILALAALRDVRPLLVQLHDHGHSVQLELACVDLVLSTAAKLEPTP